MPRTFAVWNFSDSVAGYGVRRRYGEAAAYDGRRRRSTEVSMSATKMAAAKGGSAKQSLTGVARAVALWLCLRVCGSRAGLRLYTPSGSCLFTTACRGSYYYWRTVYYPLRCAAEGLLGRPSRTTFTEQCDDNSLFARTGAFFVPRSLCAHRFPLPPTQRSPDISWRRGHCFLRALSFATPAFYEPVSPMHT